MPDVRPPGWNVSKLLALRSRADIISFAGGIPDPSLFPNEALRVAPLIQA
jgi:DNA-binding transcriptional MocR family regulator